MKRSLQPILLLLAVSSLARPAPGQEARVGTLTGHAAAGKKAFPRNCNGCHGARGDGNGTFAPYLEPRPRDFTAAIFKCRSTPTGSLPTDQDLFNTLTRGIVTTAMPSWVPLTAQTRVDIIAYLKTFAPRFAHELPAAPIVIPPESPITLAGLQHGAALYRKLDCASCHGKEGRGDGPLAATLLDAKHRPLPAYDFTATPRFKCGTTNADLYLILLTGLDGSAMPAYAGQLDPPGTWDLVHFLRTLQPTRQSEENTILNANGGRKTLAPIP